MTVVRLAVTELIRVVSGRMTALAAVVIVLLPAALSGVYLYADSDPYAHLDRVPVALVVHDAGAVLPEGTQVNEGDHVASVLLANQAFDFHRVSADEAANGLRTDTYLFVLTVPRAFSASLVSARSSAAGQLTLMTTATNAYLRTTVADRLVDVVRRALINRIGVAAAQRSLLGLTHLHSRLAATLTSTRSMVADAKATQARTSGVSTDAQHLAFRDGLLATRAGALSDRSSRLAVASRATVDGQARLANRLDQVAAAAVPWIGDSRRMLGSAHRVTLGLEGAEGTAGSLSGSAAAAVRALASERLSIRHSLHVWGLSRPRVRQILGYVDALQAPTTRANALAHSNQTQLSTMSAESAQTAGIARRLAGSLPGTLDSLSAGDTAAHHLTSGVGALASSARRLHSQAFSLHTRERAAASVARHVAAAARALPVRAESLATTTRGLGNELSSAIDQVPDLNTSSQDRVAAVLGDPVRLVSQGSAGRASYRAGLIPLAWVLAVWVGSYALFLLLRPMSKRALAASVSAPRVALSGWGAPLALGVLQVVPAILLARFAFHLSAGPTHLVAAMGFLALVAAAFVAVMQALNAWFGRTGQLLGLAFILAQLVTAGGVFPWQTLPMPLRTVHALMPMSYAVDGVRRVLYGGVTPILAADVVVLVALLCAGLLFTTAAARLQRVWTVAQIRPEPVLALPLAAARWPA
jgi:putative membrane protein